MKRNRILRGFIIAATLSFSIMTAGKMDAHAAITTFSFEEVKGSEYKNITKVEASTLPNFEEESNDVISTANKIKLKNTYNGIVSGNFEEDWFVFKAPSTGAYKFYAKNTLPSGNEMGVMQGYTKQNNIDLSCHKILQIGSNWQASRKIKLRKGQKYYIQMSAVGSDSYTYQLKVKKIK